MTILTFPDVCKAPTDVVTVALDWSAFAPQGQTQLASHSVSVRSGALTAVDETPTGLVQKITVSGGIWKLHAVVEATVSFADGTTFTRGFDVIVR